MEREKRPDMFDVAAGECDLLDFLVTRFNPLDLKTKINFAPGARVDEQFAPKKPEEEEETQVAAPQPPPPEAQRPQIVVGDARDRVSTGPTPVALGPDSVRTGPRPPDVSLEDVELRGEDEDEVDFELEPVGAAPAPPASSPAPPVQPPLQKGPDWLSLIQGFHDARQRYEAAQEDKDEEA